MKMARGGFGFRSVLALAALLLWQGLAAAAGMGMGSFGKPAATTPDLVITPGPIKSPLRIVAAGNGFFYVSDYQGQQVVRIARNAPDRPEPFLPIDGQPLGVEATKKFLFVGNDSSGTIDLYQTVSGHKIKSFASDTPMQASDLAYDAAEGLLFVADSRNRDVKVFSMLGRPVAAFGSSAPLAAPKGIAIDPVARQVFVTDYGDSRVGIAASINIFDYEGRLLKRITGAFARPQGIAVDGGRICLVDAMLGQVLVYDRTTYQKTATLGSFGTAAGSLLLPMDLALDSVTGNLFVTNNRMGRVDVFALPKQ